MSTPPSVKKPLWLKKKIHTGGALHSVRSLLGRCRLHTVCEEARCPNLGECFSLGTATFLILGDVCTRSCRFCTVAGGPPDPPDPDEPSRVADAVRELGLSYAVVTSVTRDDLDDGGASLFAETIGAVHNTSPGTGVEVLIPDFRGDRDALRTVLDARPDVLNHNVETVPRLYPAVRPEADYRRSLGVLGVAAACVPAVPVKSGIMLGLGETDDELRRVLDDLLAAGCRLLTLGQYISPSRLHYPVERYVPPEEFERWRETALDTGFKAVASGPFVRSSYHAAEMVNWGA